MHAQTKKKIYRLATLFDFLLSPSLPPCEKWTWSCSKSSLPLCNRLCHALGIYQVNEAEVEENTQLPLKTKCFGLESHLNSLHFALQSLSILLNIYPTLDIILLMWKKAGGKRILSICWHSTQGASTLKYALVPQLAGILKQATLKDTQSKKVGGKNISIYLLSFNSRIQDFEICTSAPVGRYFETCNP